MKVSKLIPNSQKTEFMIIGHPLNTRKLELPEALELKGSEINRVQNTKYLKIIINENLDWDEFKRIRSKVNASLMSLKRLKSFCCKVSSAMHIMVLLKAVCALVMLSGGTFNKTKMTSLQRLQNRTC